MIRKIMSSLFAICVVTISASASAEQLASTWSLRGVFVFGDVSLDFQLEREKFGPFVSQLQDCSTSAFLCARADVVQVVLPRRCGSAVGQSWSVGDVTTTVISSFDVPLTPHNPSETMYLIGSPDRPWIVYLYSLRRGVTRLYYDDAKRIDFFGAAARGELDHGQSRETLQRLSEEHRTLARLSFGLITFDSFGACDRSAVE